MANSTLDISTTTCPSCGRENPSDARFCGGCGEILGASLHASPKQHADPLVGKIIAGRYELMELIGRGGMGVVYKARHLHIGKEMAVKLLRGELARQNVTVARFQREARIISQLSHPNTVQVFDFGESDGMVYLVMEFLEGEDMSDLIRREAPLEFDRVARLMLRVCSSLTEAHRLGIVHRDLKPENIKVLVDIDGQEVPKVLDFGLAKLREGEGQEEQALTRAGAVVGTPYYMSPEQIRGESLDARSDIYSLGAVLYKALTGAPPFQARTPMGVLTKHLTEEPVAASSRKGVSLPSGVDEILERCLAKSPKQRYESCAELADALRECMEQRPVRDATQRIERDDTRDEVVEFERRIRTRAALLRALFAIAAVAVVATLGFFGVRFFTTPTILSAELEPNNARIEANVLTRDTELVGSIGARQSEMVGDVDFYAIEGTGLAEIALSGVPGLDLRLELYGREGQEPLVVVDEGGPGEGERLSGYPLIVPKHFVAVRQTWVSGQQPAEDVRESYAIRWSIRAPEDDMEQEFNDSLSRPTTVAVGTTMRASIGWAGDLDVFCVEPSESADTVTIEISGIEGADLVLRPMQIAIGRSRVVDEHGVGEGEILADMPPEDLCVEISIRDDRGTRRAGPDATYTVSVRE